MNTTHHTSLMTASTKTDFLKEVRLLERENDAQNDIQIEQGKKPVPSEDQVASKESTEQGTEHYKELLGALLTTVGRYRKSGAVLLKSEGYNAYRLAPWGVPPKDFSAKQLQDHVRNQMNDDALKDVFGVTQVQYAFRLCTRNHPVLVYGTDASDAVAMYLFDEGVWHKLQAIKTVIEFAIRCAAAAPASLNLTQSFSDADHAELKQGYQNHPHLRQVLCEMDNRLHDWMTQVDAREEMLRVIARHTN